MLFAGDNNSIVGGSPDGILSTITVTSEYVQCPSMSKTSIVMVIGAFSGMFCANKSTLNE